MHIFENEGIIEYILDLFGRLLVIFMFMGCWPIIIASIVVSLAGIIKRKVAWLKTGSLLYLPFTYYLLGGPGSRYIALLFIMLQVGAVLALKRNIAWLACLLLAPIIVFTGWMAYSVYWQPPLSG